MSKENIKCFISYSHKDKRMANRFLDHFKALQRLYNIDNWYDGMIPAGEDIDKEVLTNLKDSDIVFLLISPNFISSYYCFEKELKTAIGRHKKNNCIVIPIILRSFVSGNYPFSKLKYIPTDGKPIDQFKTQNDGFVDAFTGIKNLLEVFLKKASEKPISKPTSKSRRKSTPKPKATSKSKSNAIKYEIVKNGNLSKINLQQKDMDLFVKYSNELPQLINELNKLINNQTSHFSSVISKKDAAATVLKHGRNDVESFLLQLFSYIQQRLVGIENTCVHFRVERNNYYKTFSEVGYPLIGLKTEPILGTKSIIACSKSFDMPVIKDYNKMLHKEAHPSESIQRNYITFTFNNISKIFDVNISMCISITGRGNYNGIFIPMAVLRFDRIIERYLIDYISSCEKANPNYNIKKILNCGGK